MRLCRARLAQLRIEPLVTASLALPHGHSLTFGPALIMGIVNVTPDSFSDGGAFATTEAAVAQGERMAREGAAILDIGGESTRPHALPVGADEEMARVLPVIESLHRRVAIPLSVDTMKAEVAAAAVEAGASIINDVWGFQRDAGMAAVAARTGAAAVVMHNRGHAGVDPDIDIMADVLGFLARSIAAAAVAGVPRSRLIVDPGFGFGKTDAQNLTLIRELRQLEALGCPILVGVSRKSSLGRISGQPVASERLPASLAAALWAVACGAAIIRVHDVAAHVQALKVHHAIERDR
jgi:dihydropteroate synthase